MVREIYTHLFSFIDDNKIDYQIENQTIRFKDFDFSLYLVLDSTDNSVTKFEKLRKNEWDKNAKFLIFIWFDLWDIKSEIIKSKIKHLCGLSNKKHARKTKVKQVNKTDSELFFNVNHLNQPLIGYKRFGLYINTELIALASFAKKRKFRDDTYSAELLQFSTKNGIHINGGLSKLVKHFYRTYPVSTIMTYIDLDWTNGNKFKTIGFFPVEHKAPMYFSLCKNSKQRKLTAQPTPIFNMGSVKSILTID